jgi:hypothetical protein
MQTGRQLCVAENVGSIVLKDQNVVMFYTNDLANTPTFPFPEPDEELICCVHGLVSLKR